MKKVATVFGKFLLGLLAFILCVALFVSTVLTIVVADVRIVTDKDNINTLITGYLTGKSTPRRYPVVSGMPLQEKAHRAPIRNLDSADFDISMLEDPNALVELFYDAVKESVGEELPISLEEVQNFVEESTLSDFIVEKSSSLISDFLTGEKTTTITVEEIVEQLEQNAPLIEQTFQVTIDETIISEMTDSLEESGILEELEEGGLEAILDLADSPSQDMSPESGVGSEDKNSSAQAPGLSQPNQNVPEKELTLISAIQGIISGELDISKLSVPQLLNLFRSAISQETLLACIGLCVLLMGLVFLTQWKRYYSAMIKIGITLLVTGLICMIPAVIVWVAPELVISLLGDMAFAMKLIKMIVGMTYVVPAGVAAGGLVLIVAGGILRSVAKKRAIKAGDVVAVQVAAEPEVTEDLSMELLEAEPVAEDAEEEVSEEETEEAEEAEDAAEETPEEAEEASEEEPAEV